MVNERRSLDLMFQALAERIGERRMTWDRAVIGSVTVSPGIPKTG
jgi:hypothetical protein